MNTAITSYVRHIIVVGVLFLLEKYRFPMEGATEFADGLALAALGTVTWLVVKYLPAIAKHIGLLAVLIMSLVSCAELPITARISGPDGMLSYSAKRGLVVEAVVRSTK
jgi:hypothetical protein